MKQRRFSRLHFINAIKGDLVTKVRNVDFYRKPALVFKTVKEILETLDAKKLQPSTSRDAEFPDLSSRCARFKTKRFYLPYVERSLEKLSPTETGSILSDADDGLDEMTLMQLKEMIKTKKRKLINSIDFEKRPKLEPDEVDSDTEPLSSLRLKLTKAKIKHTQATLKSEQDADHEVQFPRDSSLVFHVKTEVPDPLISECQLKILSIDDCSNIGQGFESSLASTLPDRDQKTVECQNIEPISFVGLSASCSLSEVSYDHLQDVKPNSISIPTCEETMDVDGHEENCQQFPDLPSSECEIETAEEQPFLVTLLTMDENLDTNSFSRSSSHITEFIEQESDHQAVLASNLAVDDCIIGNDRCHGNVSLLSSDDTKNDLASNQQMDATSSPASTFSTFWEHPLCSSANDNLLCGKTEQKQLLPCSSPNGGERPANPRNDLVSLEGKSTSDEHEENKTSDHFGGEIQERFSSPMIQSCDIDETLSTSVLVQPPERLLSTRKVISPSSEERLSLAINSAETYIKEDCKENPCLNLSDQTEDKGSSVSSDVEHANEVRNPKGFDITNQTKVIIRRPKTARPSKRDRRNSPPKGNFEGPRLCRSLPRVSTGCTSLQGCSESAIAFSQRQMHDIESLGMKLMSELNYMKVIVEEKLLFEGYRNASIKNDADEVKDAITNAVKVEETARKWLSMMARDCNRFCKIMSLTQKGPDPATSNNGIQQKRKKITFADEAGGMLCHVKVFGNEMPLDSDSEKQKTQTE